MVGMHKRHNILIAACIAAVFSAVVAVVMSRLWCPMKKPEVFPRSVPTQVRVKVSDKVLPRPEADQSEVNVSAAVSVVCGLDDATADRYEERNDALRSIARRRDIAQGDIRTLMAYVRAAAAARARPSAWSALTSSARSTPICLTSANTTAATDKMCSKKLK